MRKLKYCFMVLLLLLGCSQNIADGIKKERLILDFVSKNCEKSLREIIIDTISTRINKRNIDVQSLLFSEWDVEKLIILNKEKEKFYTTINIRYSKHKDATSDEVQRIFGIKIKGKWHIYMGAHLILPRSAFKYNPYEPLSWDEISYLAHENFFKRYISFNKKGIAIINEIAFDRDISPDVLAPQQMSKTNDIERMFEMQTEEINSEIMPESEYVEIIDYIKKSKTPKDFKINKITWWDKLWGPEEPIFETKEWKEYLRKKYGDDAKGK